jgi:hypothetical protein
MDDFGFGEGKGSVVTELARCIHLLGGLTNVLLILSSFVNN